MMLTKLSGLPARPTVSHVHFSTRGVTDLNELIDPASGWILNNATGINESSQIIGRGMINGENHAFLLTRADAVPEPAS